MVEALKQKEEKIPVKASEYFHLEKVRADLHGAFSVSFEKNMAIIKVPSLSKKNEYFEIKINKATFEAILNNFLQPTENRQTSEELVKFLSLFSNHSEVQNSIYNGIEIVLFNNLFTAYAEIYKKTGALENQIINIKFDFNVDKSFDGLYSFIYTIYYDLKEENKKASDKTNEQWLEDLKGIYKTDDEDVVIEKLKDKIRKVFGNDKTSKARFLDMIDWAEDKEQWLMLGLLNKFLEIAQRGKKVSSEDLLFFSTAVSNVYTVYSTTERGVFGTTEMGIQSGNLSTSTGVGYQKQVYTEGEPVRQWSVSPKVSGIKTENGWDVIFTFDVSLGQFLLSVPLYSISGGILDVSSYARVGYGNVAVGLLSGEWTAFSGIFTINLETGKFGTLLPLWIYGILTGFNAIMRVPQLAQYAEPQVAAVAFATQSTMELSGANSLLEILNVIDYFIPELSNKGAIKSQELKQEIEEIRGLLKQNKYNDALARLESLLESKHISKLAKAQLAILLDQATDLEFVHLKAGESIKPSAAIRDRVLETMAEFEKLVKKIENGKKLTKEEEETFLANFYYLAQKLSIVVTPDNRILQANRHHLEDVEDYVKLFQMLARAVGVVQGKEYSSVLAEVVGSYKEKVDKTGTETEKEMLNSYIYRLSELLDDNVMSSIGKKVDYLRSLVGEDKLTDKKNLIHSLQFLIEPLINGVRHTIYGIYGHAYNARLMDDVYRLEESIHNLEHEDPEWFQTEETWRSIGRFVSAGFSPEFLAPINYLRVINSIGTIEELKKSSLYKEDPEFKKRIDGAEKRLQAFIKKQERYRRVSFDYDKLRELTRDNERKGFDALHDIIDALDNEDEFEDARKALGKLKKDKQVTTLTDKELENLEAHLKRLDDLKKRITQQAETALDSYYFGWFETRGSHIKLKDKAVDLLAEYAALNHQEHAIKYLLENKKISDEDYETANAYIQKKKTEVNAQSDKLMEDRDTYYAIIKDPKFKERVKGAYAKSWLEFGKIASKFDTETLELLIKERDKGVWKAIELFRQESNLIETTGMLAKEINILRSEVKYLERLKETLHALNEMEESDETEDALDAVDDAIEELNELLKSYQEALDNSIKLYVHHSSAEDYKKQLTQYARYVKKVYETIKPEEFKKQKPRRIESDLW
ncbi:hypothetical protein J4450_02425 [Candidatus Micrarchaeota archaeon]|nr:hypothetical protein [Candidatus Micrarchaeota archaeon]